MKFFILLIVAILAGFISAEQENKDEYYQSTGSGSGNTIGSHNSQAGNSIHEDKDQVLVNDPLWAYYKDQVLVNDPLWAYYKDQVLVNDPLWAYYKDQVLVNDPLWAYYKDQVLANDPLWAYYKDQILANRRYPLRVYNGPNYVLAHTELLTNEKNPFYYKDQYRKEDEYWGPYYGGQSTGSGSGNTIGSHNSQAGNSISGSYE